MNVECRSKKTNFVLNGVAGVSFNVTIVSGWLNNLSCGTFNPVILNAPTSPGEHGVRRSFIIMDFLSEDGPRTF